MTDFDRTHGNIALKAVKEDGIASDKIIRRKQDGTLEYQRDDLTIEEPLEIRIGRKTVATTMRTPGRDEELAAGFSFPKESFEHLKRLINSRVRLARVIAKT